MAKFTVAALDAFRVRSDWKEVRSKGETGFGVVRLPSGELQFRYTYTFAGQKRRMSLGLYGKDKTLSEARRDYLSARKLVADGIDPLVKKNAERQEIERAVIEARRHPTVEALAGEYLERWARKRKRTAAEDERMLAKDVLPAWGKLKAREITRRDVRELVARIAERAPIVANRVLEVISKMFNYALEQDIVNANPCAGVRPPGTERARERVLSPGEITVFWTAIDEAQMSAHVRLCLRLLLVTAQRRGEVAGMRWDEIDTENGWWTIPGARSKNGRAHRIPLSSLALTILEELRGIAASGTYVFPSPRARDDDDQNNDRPINDGATTRALWRCRATLGVNDFNVHDLRRTAASHMASLGIPRTVIAKILNHTDQDVTGRHYELHSYDQEKRRALDAWASRLREIITDQAPATNVVDLRR